MPRTATSRYSLLAVVGITALAVAACGSTTSGSPASSAGASGTGSASPAPLAQGRNHVAGLVASVSGSTVQVTRQNATVTVTYSPATKISEVTPAQFTDVTAGSCIAVRPSARPPPSGGAATVTARMVSINALANGRCQAPHGRGGLAGTVSSVNGNTIVLNAIDSNGTTSQTNVQVDNTTRYARLAAANSQAIAQGKCLAARGTNDSTGTLQATTINLRPADNGTCMQPTGGRHHWGH